MRILISAILAVLFILAGCSSEEKAPTDSSIPTPGDVVVLEVTPTLVRLVWTDHSETESGYRVEKFIEDSSDWSTLADLPANSESYSDNRVQEAKRPGYRIRIVEEGRLSAPSDEIFVTIPLVAPTILLATAPAEKTVNLYWNDLSSANNGYEVFRHGGLDDYVQIGWTAGNTYTDTTIELADRYTYKVRAGLDTLYSLFSNEANATSPFFPPVDLVGTRVSTTAINLRWQDGSRVEQEFELERKVDGGAYFRLVVLPANQTAYSDTGLTPATTYSYRVRGIHAQLTSAYSNETRVTTSILTPVAPSELVAESRAQLPGRIVLTWNDNASNENEYVIEMRDNAEAAWQEVSHTLPNSEIYTSSPLTVESTYDFRVFALNDEGPSDYSNIASATVVGIPARPGNLRIELHEWREAVISWEDSSRFEDGFIVERNTPPSVDWRQVGSTSMDSTSFVDSSIEQEHSYFYRVASFNEVGSSPFTDSVGVEVASFRPNAPDEMTASGTSWRFATIGWRDNSDNEDGFQLERREGGAPEWDEVAVVDSNIVLINDSTVIDGSNYLYRVRSFNGAGRSEYASEVAVQIPERRPPMPPASLAAIAVNSRRVMIGWAHIDNNEFGFCVQRKFQWEEEWPADSVWLPPNSSQYTDSTVVSELSYTYRVWAYNDVGASEYSNEATANVPARLAAPINLAVGEISIVTIELNWEDAAVNEVVYLVERSMNDSSNFETVTILPENTNTCVDRDLEPETTYYYRVYCTNETEGSEYSSIVSGTTSSLTIYADDFEDHEPNAQPPDPWEVQIVEEGIAEISEDSGFDNSQALHFRDPGGGQNSAMVTLNTEPLSKGVVELDLKISPNSYFGIIAADESANRYITWQIQFNQDSSFYVREGRDLARAEGLYPVDEWFTVKVQFDTDSSKYIVYFNEEAVTRWLDLQRNDHIPNGLIVFIEYSDVRLTDGYVDNFVLRHTNPYGEGREEFEHTSQPNGSVQDGRESISTSLRAVEFNH